MRRWPVWLIAVGLLGDLFYYLWYYMDQEAEVVTYFVGASEG